MISCAPICLAGDLNEHEADGSTAENCHGVADLHPGFMETAENAGQRFRHRRIFKGHVGRDDQHVGFDDALRDPNVFCVGAIIEEEIFAEIFLMLGAVEAHLARSGVQGYDAHALLETIDPGADFLNYAGQFVAEQGGRNDHAGMVATLVHLKIGAAGQGDLYFDQNLAVSHARDGYFFDLEVFLAVQDGGGHFSVHGFLPVAAYVRGQSPGYIAFLIGTTEVMPFPNPRDDSKSCPSTKTNYRAQMLPG